MKSFFKYLGLALVMSLYTNCEEDLIVFNDSSFVQLQDASAVSVVENSGAVVSIVAQLGAPQDTDTTVSFETTGDASRFSLSSSSVVIPAGETQGFITLTPTDDDDINGDIDITISLSASSDLPVGIGGNPLSDASKVITIVDDNVPCNNYVLTFVTDRWGSKDIWDILDSNGTTVATGGPYTDLAANGDTFTDEVSVPLEDGCYTFRAFDWYGDSYSAGGASYSLQCGALVAGTGDGTLTGISGLNIATVPVNPNYGSQFRSASATSGSAPYSGHAESFDFCVNQ